MSQASLTVDKKTPAADTTQKPDKSSQPSTPTYEVGAPTVESPLTQAQIVSDLTNGAADKEKGNKEPEKDFIDRGIAIGEKLIASAKVTVSTISGGFALAREANPTGTNIRIASAIVDAGNPVVSGLLLKTMIDTIMAAGPTHYPTVIGYGAAALTANVAAAVLKTASNRQASLTSQALEVLTERRVSLNLASRYEEVFSAEKNSQVVMLRENMWRIYFLPDTALAVAGVAASTIGVGLALSQAPLTIIAGAAIVATIPTINQIIQANEVHRDEASIAGTRRKYWYQSWFSKSQDALRELLLLGARDDLADRAMTNLDKIHEQQRKRSWGFMVREMFATPINAGFTLFATGYMYSLVKSTSALANPVTLGDVSFVVGSTIPLLMGTISQMGRTFSAGYEASPFYRAYKELSKTVVRVVKLGAEKKPQESGCRLALDGMSFTYDRKGELPDTLSNVSLDIGAGQFVGVVGEIGAGKTTMFELLCGLRTPTGGRLLINGKPLTEDNRSDWVKRIGFVFQDPFPFSSLTMREFLSLGNADVDEAYLNKVLELTGLKNILEERYETKSGEKKSRFPNGLETPLGEEFEGGKKLSGGERQLLSICRALLRKPDVLFLDEATANLNPTQRAKIRELIEHRQELLGINPTVIQVSHTLKAVKNANVIYFVDKATRGIAEAGTHSELIAKDGLYAREWEAEQKD